jgi:hypothetical protein
MSDKPAQTVQPVPQSTAPVSFADIVGSDPRRTTRGPRLSVRFLRRWTMYFAGDVATFSRAQARELVEQDFAEPVNWGDPTKPIPTNAVLGMRYPAAPPERRRSEVEA